MTVCEQVSGARRVRVCFELEVCDVEGLAALGDVCGRSAEMEAALQAFLEGVVEQVTVEDVPAV